MILADHARRRGDPPSRLPQLADALPECPLDHRQFAPLPRQQAPTTAGNRIDLIAGTSALLPIMSCPSGAEHRRQPLRFPEHTLEPVHLRPIGARHSLRRAYTIMVLTEMGRDPSKGGKVNVVT